LSSCFRRASAIRRSRFRRTSATAGSAGCCPPLRSRSWRRPGNIFAGLWLPGQSRGDSASCVGWLALPETRGRPIG
jgi:hypothetical protein